MNRTGSITMNKQAERIVASDLLRNDFGHVKFLESKETETPGQSSRHPWEAEAGAWLSTTSPVVIADLSTLPLHCRGGAILETDWFWLAYFHDGKVQRNSLCQYLCSTFSKRGPTVYLRVQKNPYTWDVILSISTFHPLGRRCRLLPNPKRPRYGCSGPHDTLKDPGESTHSWLFCWSLLIWISIRIIIKSRL